MQVPTTMGRYTGVLANSFFPVSEDNLGEGSRQEISDEISAIQGEEGTQSCESS